VEFDVMQNRSLLTTTTFILWTSVNFTSCGKPDDVGSRSGIGPSSQAKTDSFSGQPALTPQRDAQPVPQPVDLSSRDSKLELDGLNRLIATSNHIAQGDVRITYGYDGQFGNYNIADTAVASLNGQKIAEAKTISIQRNPGERTQVRETHFAESGAVIYTGLLFFSDSGCSRLEAEMPISGNRRYRVFSQWPLSVGAMGPCPF